VIFAQGNTPGPFRGEIMDLEEVTDRLCILSNFGIGGLSNRPELYATTTQNG